MDRPLVVAERRAFACLLELAAVLAAAAAAYELAVVLLREDGAAYEQISWCDDGVASWDSPQIDLLDPAPSGAAVLSFGRESLPMRLVGLGCALLGVASSLYARIRRLVE